MSHVAQNGGAKEGCCRGLVLGLYVETDKVGLNLWQRCVN